MSDTITLKIKTSHAPELSKPIAAMLSTLSGREVEEVVVPESIERDGSTVFKISYDVNTPADLMELEAMLEHLSNQRYAQYEQFADISALDYVVSIEADSLNPAFVKLLEDNQEFVHINLQVIQHILQNEIAIRQRLEVEIEEMREFIKQSGLIYYKALMEHVVDSLDSHNIINKNDLKSELFTTIH